MITERSFPLHDADGDRTVEWFMKVPFAQPHGGVLWTNADDASDGNRFNIFWGAEFIGIANTVSGDFRGPGGIGPYAIAEHENATIFPLGEWIHVAIVRTNTGGGFDWQWFTRWVLYVLMNVDDFAAHNYYAFRPGESGGKWQSLAYDFDSGFTHARVGLMRALYGDGKSGDNWLC